MDNNKHFAPVMAFNRIISYLRSANGEAIGIISVTPLVVFFIAVMIDVAHIAILTNHLTYSTYIACRAAAVSETYSTAKRRAGMAFSSNMNDMTVVDVSGDDGSSGFFDVEDEDATAPDDIDWSDDSLKPEDYAVPEITYTGPAQQEEAVKSDQARMEVYIVDSDGTVISSGKSGSWSSENFVQCIVTIGVDTMFDFFDTEKTCTVTQGIEIGGVIDPEDDDFDDEEEE